MKAIILCYLDCSVAVANIPNDADVEEYLTIQLGIHLDEINYMTAPDDEEIPVYPCGCDTLTTTPIAVL